MVCRDFFISKLENIGSLVLFLKNKKNIEYLSYLNNQIPSDIIDRSIQEKIWYYVNDIETIQNCICGNHLSFIERTNLLNRDPNKTELSIMHDLGYYRIFDCGAQKWEIISR